MNYILICIVILIILLISLCLICSKYNTIVVNKSIEMFNIYCKHYGLTTAEEIARCWNGGPRGMQNNMTAGYWKKVKNQLDS